MGIHQLTMIHKCGAATKLQINGKHWRQKDKGSPNWVCCNLQYYATSSVLIRKQILWSGGELQNQYTKTFINCSRRFFWQHCADLFCQGTSRQLLKAASDSCALNNPAFWASFSVLVNPLNSKALMFFFLSLWPRKLAYLLFSASLLNMIRNKNQHGSGVAFSDHASFKRLMKSNAQKIQLYCTSSS